MTGDRWVPLTKDDRELLAAALEEYYDARWIDEPAVVAKNEEDDSAMKVAALLKRVA